MKVTGPSTEDEMILAFLRAEIESPLYQQNILRIPGAQDLVVQADPDSEEENRSRRALLGLHRGYGWALFEGFPNDLAWQRVRLTTDELRTARYANYPTWLTLTGGTRLIDDGAKNVGMEWPAQSTDKDPSSSIKAIAARFKGGETFSELIFVAEPEAGTPDRWVLIEGHSRATAYVYAEAEREIEALIGFSPAIVRWRWY